MSALHTQYLAEIIEAHREGLRILRELATTETDPAERRRLAIALVRVRPIKDPEPDMDDTAPNSPRSAKSRARDERAPANTPAHAHADLAPANQAAPSTNPQSEALNQSTHSAPSTSSLPPPPPGYRDCTHPALPPPPGMHIRQLLKRARSA